MENLIILQGLTVEQLTDAIADAVLKKLKMGQKNLEEQGLLTIKETSGMLKISRQTLYAMRKDGRIKGVTIGRSIRFSHAEIKRLISESGGKYRLY